MKDSQKIEERLQRIEREAEGKLRKALENPVVYSDFRSHIRRAAEEKIASDELRGVLFFDDLNPSTDKLAKNASYSSATRKTFGKLLDKYGQIVVDDVARRIAKANDYYPRVEEYQRGVERSNNPKPLPKSQSDDDDSF